ncbi:glycosyltransferase family 2 protein [Flavobacterium sp.]|uniref:glycosyltransferase family 2 protein n=1 Tax=Flavobacterium sp. TaxID=239 RepID=UPI003752891D
MKLVTVGIPFYNTEAYIENCVQSILNQSYKNLEIILLDDGSKDNSLEIVKKFNDPRIKIISDGENKGLIFRLNQLIDIAKGEYFARMDADDVMFPQRIQKQLEILEKQSNVNVVHSDAVSIDDKNKILGYRNSASINTPQDILDRKVPIHPTVFAKTSWFKKYHYSKQYHWIEDFELWNRSSKETIFYNIKEPLLFYREISQNNSKKFLASLPSKRLFMKDYKLPFSYSLNFIYINYLKFMFYKILEILNLENIAIKHRFKVMETKEYEKYNTILHDQCITK